MISHNKSNGGVDLLLQRIAHTENSTYGVLFDHKQEHLSTVIEDTFRKEKVENETRIPAGYYQIKYREVLSGKTKQYREKFPEFFTWHLELQNVPNFEYIYGHIGNSHKDSSGCLLFNEGFIKKGDTYVGISSTSAFIEVYEYISQMLDDGIEVWIKIQDEDVLKAPF